MKECNCRKLLIGLGNPEPKYRNNRHNAGQMFLDYLAQERGLAWKKRKELKSFMAEDKDVVLAKPLVFMNASGEAVKLLVQKLLVDTKDLYVVHDELDLPLGQYKLTFEKSSPLHKGVLSTEQYLKTKDFWRLRIGVDNRNPEHRIEGERYVLQDFSKEEAERLRVVFEEVWNNFKLKT